MAIEDIDGGVRVGDRTSGSRGGPALTAPESLDPTEDWAARHLLRSGRALTTANLTIQRENGERVVLLPKPGAEERRADAPLVAEPEEDVRAAPRPRRRPRLAAVVEQPLAGWHVPDRVANEDTAVVPTLAYLAHFERRMEALIAKHERVVTVLIRESEQRVLATVDQMLDWGDEDG